MSKKGKDFKEKGYKFITQEEAVRLRAKTNEELNKEYVDEMRQVKATRNAKKNDQKLQELTKLIKEHQKKDSPENDEITALKSKIQEQKEIRDEPISDAIEERADLNKEWKHQEKAHLERADLILNILSGRVIK